MKCKNVQQHLLDYSESQLDQKTHAMVEEHLRDCTACTKDLQDFEQTVQLLQSTPLEAPPDEFWDDFTSGVMRKVRRMDTPSRQLGSVFFPKMKMATVALATIIIVLGLIVSYTTGVLEEHFPSLFKTSRSMLVRQTEQQRDTFEARLESLIPKELVKDILESDFALLGGEVLSGLPTDANDETLYLLIESLDEQEKALLLSELENMREDAARP